MQEDMEDQVRQRERLLLGSETRYDQSEVAQRAGISVERAMALWRAMGFPVPEPEDIAFTKADVEGLRAFAVLLQSSGLEQSVELAMARSLGQAMARIADAQLGNLARLLIDRIPDPADEAASANAIGIAEPLLPLLEQTQRYVWLRHLFAASEQVFARLAQPADSSTLVVGFADITGFTGLSRGLSARRFAEFIEHFEATTAAVVTDHGGRVIKTVGDEVMFVVASPTAATQIGLELSEWTSVLDGRRALHVGMALGPVLRRLGDVYGTVVNIASRLTSVARSGTVLIDRELAGTITDHSDYQLKRLRPVQVRGFSQMQPWLLRRR